MLYVIRFFPEITIKTRSVRQRLIKTLRRNLRILMGRIDSRISVTGDWDILEVETNTADETLLAQVVDVLRNTPGISLISQVSKQTLPDFDGILTEILPYYRDQLQGRSFAVRSKRQGNHDFSSMELERYLGAALLRETGASGVDLRQPDVTVRLEIRQQTLYVVTQQWRGLGGYPMGTQEPVLSLISGGFDSAVSSYLFMRRGVQTHFLFFNLGGKEHELAVKEVALYLWMRFGASHRVKFISVPFEPLLGEILTRVDSGHMAVVLKRMMIRAADQIAREMKLSALVTGECVAQVASQTLPNLNVIDQVTDMLVLRPLIVTDKQDIIDMARRIGTEEFSAQVPEYCGVVSVKPTTNAKLQRVLEEEAKLDIELINAAVAEREVQMIDRVVEVLEHRDVEPEQVTDVPAGAMVIDIRHPQEQERAPLSDEHYEVAVVPFYQLSTQFAMMDASRQYLLYCDKGMMSRLHASHLKDAGYQNVGVYRPSA
ncbi:tRNA uracil 4-sulfurtransferase ThiI [Pseudohongiella acticola]|uniref:tRNA uracil 4-sulfurtransferase ThiI n=1 Tax=Pseudohongiella acticola TaxID=1524254 RepID=UPI0030ED594C